MNAFPNLSRLLALQRANYCKGAGNLQWCIPAVSTAGESFTEDCYLHVPVLCMGVGGEYCLWRGEAGKVGLGVLVTGEWVFVMTRLTFVAPWGCDQWGHVPVMIGVVWAGVCGREN